MAHNKILIVGISATGKSRLARFLHKKLSLPLVHMDQLWWGPNWIEQDEALVAQALRLKLRKEDWIIEGYIEPLGTERCTQADLIIYLDYSGLEALKGQIERLFKRKRPEMPDGCIDKFDLKYMWTVFQRKERPEIEKIISKFENKTVRIKSRSALEQYLSDNY